MKSSRRSFLKAAGIAALGLGARPVVSAIAESEKKIGIPNPKALTAKRWAMVVDLRDGCPDGCKACTEVCHRIHNVPDFGNPKDEIKWIWTESYGHAFPGQEHKYLHDYEEEGLKGSPVPVLCNHCDNPPCVRVCPTKATFKRKEDGVVMMDYHRCIGCRFCMAGCPYGARSMNWRDPRPFLKEINAKFPTRNRGVVEKCNFCAERLAIGQIPACVEECGRVTKKEGLKPVLHFGDMENSDSDTRELVRLHHTIRRKPHLGTMPQVYYIL
ncbi:MAG: sulfate reduction electron transfer complex DsrMKJOP subunit DsrO [Planctomycetota bacterium]|jgi:molybdopterin-containing oxidoreductase family iron-sulfur binding subunit